MNKKGEELLYKEIIFLILFLIFFGIVYAFILRAVSNASLYEQAYSKEIALFIDKAKPGMSISLNLGDI